MKSKINFYGYKLLSFMYKITLLLSIYLFKIFSFPFLIIPVKNQIISISYYGREISENARVVTDTLSNSHNCKCIWLVNNPEDYVKLQDRYKIVKNNCFSRLYYLSVSSVWLDNSRKMYLPFKRKQQTYIQFWHGGLGMKKIEKDSLTPNWFGDFISSRDSKYIDIMVSNSSHLSKVFRSAMKYDGKILESGYPMNDILFSNMYKCDFDKKKIKILYAPTFRGNEIKGSLPYYFPDLEKLMTSLNNLSTKATYELYVRTHPRLKLDDQSLINFQHVFSGNKYESIREIMFEMDFVISDYSSAIFDATIMGIPSILFVPDYNEYKATQGLYFSLEDLPFEYTCDDNKLIDIILGFNYQSYFDKIKSFHQSVDLIDDGKATNRVVRYILKILEQEE